LWTNLSKKLASPVQETPLLSSTSSCSPLFRTITSLRLLLGRPMRHRYGLKELSLSIEVRLDKLAITDYDMRPDEVLPQTWFGKYCALCFQR
jgi:hypothetical protein